MDFKQGDIVSDAGSQVQVEAGPFVDPDGDTWYAVRTDAGVTSAWALDLSAVPEYEGGEKVRYFAATVVVVAGPFVDDDACTWYVIKWDGDHRLAPDYNLRKINS